MLDILKTVVMPIVSKFIPDSSQQTSIENQLSQAMMQLQMEDAKSQDLYIRRARPTFLYLMYGMLAVSVPCGLLFMLDQELAQKFITGASLWLAGIPQSLYELFGWCFGGYTIARSFDKYVKGKKK